MATEFDLPRLDPPQRQKNKWVEFQENDIESQILPQTRRFSVTGGETHPHHPSSTPVIYTSMNMSTPSVCSSSSFTDSASLSSSLGSGGGVAGSSPPPLPPRSSTASSLSSRQGGGGNGAGLSFNSSFGGFSQSGEPASLKSAFPGPRRNTVAVSHKPRLTSVSSSESLGSSSTTTSIRVSDFNEISDLEAGCSELVLEDGEGSATSRYSALEDIRDKTGVTYTGWSNKILGEVNGWSEQIKSDGPLRPDNLYLTPAGGHITLEANTTPEIPSLRQFTWPKSPSRTFVRNFP